ncbi:hypothetical protein Slin15195_G042600 [Septoria linicola]|uniref:NIPSNAP domain-containing protein n=1 Tax=Septoria linicola TaxID=215465 RepID=A0A9Q9EGL7_9PEZI|nr:hypothetical protein Slin14017_G046120 [Septoria linicola]USW50941.1 hypothetical protein Slin15195_G042600 [Septoria linicola]
MSRRVVPRLASSLTASSTQKTAAAATAPLSTSRPFSSASVNWAKAPALADVEPDAAHVFTQKQKHFRDNLAEAHRKRKEQERASRLSAAAAQSAKSTSSSSAPSDHTSAFNDAAHGISENASHFLGSLSSVAGETARKQDANDKKKGTGLLSRVIHGTEEGREMDREIERSFSQVLARGKYVHSIVFHEVKPDKVEEYVKLVASWYPKVAKDDENHVNLVGSWRTEVGECDTFVHIWEYQRYAGYHKSIHRIQNQPEFAEFDKKLKSLITSKKTSLMQEFRFWPTSPPRQLGGVFELRSYTLHPGNLLEWETHWQKGLAARREVMEGVGAWFVQIGALNEVHHLWQFADLEERRSRREQSWSIPGWGETVHKTVPLIQSMKSRIMVPMPWSPIA